MWSSGFFFSKMSITAHYDQAACMSADQTTMVAFTRNNIAMEFCCWLVAVTDAVAKLACQEF